MARDAHASGLRLNEEFANHHQSLYTISDMSKFENAYATSRRLLR